MEIVRRNRWSVGVLAFMLVSCVFAAENATTGNPEDESGASVYLTPVQKRMQQEISIDFKETPIDDVLMIMSKQADVDIIKSPLVEGNVTATLTDVPLAEALANILEAHGYAYVTTENMIRVVLREEVLQVREKIESEIFTITYADVTEVEVAVKKFISDQGAIAANPGTSNIIVTDTESKMKAIRDFIKQIDRVTPQILVESKIYDISSKDNLDLGVEWQMGTTTAYNIGEEAYFNGDAIKILGNANPLTKTEPFITSLADGMLRFGIANSDIRLDAILHASQEDIRAKLLANPRILVLDNELAEIKIVEEIPYQELTQSSAGGNI
ncbi:MAG: secretin N-terminal domain-containing protein, partial [Planctomycetota bacterium]